MTSSFCIYYETGSNHDNNRLYCHGKDEYGTGSDVTLVFDNLVMVQSAHFFSAVSEHSELHGWMCAVTCGIMFAWCLMVRDHVRQRGSEDSSNVSTQEVSIYGINGFVMATTTAAAAAATAASAATTTTTTTINNNNNNNDDDNKTHDNDDNNDNDHNIDTNTNINTNTNTNSNTHTNTSTVAVRPSADGGGEPKVSNKCTRHASSIYATCII